MKSCWGLSRAELEKHILRLHKGDTGILKIGKALGIGTGTVQRVRWSSRALSTPASLKRRCGLEERDCTGSYRAGKRAESLGGLAGDSSGRPELAKHGPALRPG